MPFDASTAEPVTAQSGFDPETAKPVDASGSGSAVDPFVIPHEKWMEVAKSDHPIANAVKLLLEHPWDKYVASVDQAFQGPITPTHVQADEGVANLPAQVGAAGVNLAQGVAAGAISPGTAAAVVSPQTIIYSVPRFVAGGIEDIYDAVKGAFTGKAGVQETLEKGVSGVVQVAGGVAGGVHGLRGEVAPKTPQEAASALRTEAETVNDPEAKAALEAAAQKVEAKAKEGVRFDPATAEPVSVEAKPAFDPETATPADAPTGKATTGTFDSATAEPLDKSTTDFGTTPDGDTHGIAARVTDARAGAGHIDPIEPGEGISAQESVAKGREALKAGADPLAPIEDFRATGKISAEGVALARARGEELAKIASDAAEKHGIESPEYKAAAEADSEWTKAIKPMQTEWHKIGQAQQGETEIDTGTFHGLRRAFQNLADKDFTPEQAEAAQRVAEGVKKANADVADATVKLTDALKTAIPEATPKKGLGLSEGLKDAAAAARKRIIERLKMARSGLGPEDFADHAIVGAEYIANGIDSFVDWSKAMVDEFGERIRPHLEELFARAKAAAKEAPSASDVWKRAKDYLDAGETDFDDVRHKIAADTGLSVEEVTRKLAEPKSVRAITDQLYAKLAARRQITDTAKSWVHEQATPGWLRFARMLPSAFFKLATFGHGTVGMVTHAGLNVFDPVGQKAYWGNFFRQFRLVGWHDKGAFHERMMQDLVRDPNYITARRAGLANDPARYMDDYQRGWLSGYLHHIGLTGNRGFDALKLYRQDRFNQIWNDLPKSLRTPDTAKLVADSINHATGVVKTRFGEWSNWTFFAPKLEGSRWAWMIGDPLKAGKILADWKNATPGERLLALREIRQKATITGIYLSLLATNQALLSATGSKQQINFTNPTRSDFLAFKAADHNFGIVSPMLGLVRLMANLLHAATANRTKFESMKSRVDEMGTTVTSYVRGKLSPFAGVVADVATQSDFAKRPLPWSSDKVPSYLAKQGEKKYTYGEYVAEHAMPIPVEEAVREVWRKQGMSESDIEHWTMALASAAVMGGTGARMSPDTHIGQPVNPPPRR